MLCMDGLLLHLVGKRQLLVDSGAPYGNGELGDSIGESHHKSSTQGKHSSIVTVGEDSPTARMEVSAWMHQANGEGRCPPLCVDLT